MSLSRMRDFICKNSMNKNCTPIPKCHSKLKVSGLYSSLLCYIIFQKKLVVGKKSPNSKSQLFFFIKMAYWWVRPLNFSHFEVNVKTSWDQKVTRSVIWRHCATFIETSFHQFFSIQDLSIIVDEWIKSSESTFHISDFQSSYHLI